MEVEESALPLAAQVANDNALIWASDYPHERDQRDFSHDIPNLINRKDVSDELRTTALKAVGSFPSKDGSRAI